MMAGKTIYYHDLLQDDFAGNDLEAASVPADFPFAKTGLLWRMAEFLLYRVIATPLVFLIGKVGFGLRFKNRKVLRRLRGTGFYLYGNHTQGMMDAYTPTLAVFPRHAHIVVGPQAVSKPALRLAVTLLGGVPLPGTAKGYVPFLKALVRRTEQKRVVTIYPEAHIWPFYTGIRPFSDSSFAYPVRQGVPAVAFVTTYRKRRLFGRLWPCLTVTLSEPFYPDLTSGPHQARRQLRDQVYAFMCREAAKPDNYAYYRYLPAPATEETTDVAKI